MSFLLLICILRWFVLVLIVIVLFVLIKVSGLLICVFGVICFIINLCDLLENWLLVSSVIFLFKFVFMIVDVGVSIFGIFGLFLGFLKWIIIMLLVWMVFFFKVDSIFFFELKIFVCLVKLSFFLLVIFVMVFLGVRLFLRIWMWFVDLIGWFKGWMMVCFLVRLGNVLRFFVRVWLVIVIGELLIKFLVSKNFIIVGVFLMLCKFFCIKVLLGFKLVRYGIWLLMCWKLLMFKLILMFFVIVIKCNMVLVDFFNVMMIIMVFLKVLVVMILWGLMFFLSKLWIVFLVVLYFLILLGFLVGIEVL